MSYPDAAWERAMTVQEVMLKALSGDIHWFRAADILGFSPRTLRRWRERDEPHRYVGLGDKRRHSPSVRPPAAPGDAPPLTPHPQQHPDLKFRPLSPNP